MEAVATGTWLYDGSVPTVVRVIESDFDFWYLIGEADGELEIGEMPELNEFGRVYYLLHKSGWKPGEPFWPNSIGFMSLEAAKAAAEALLPGEVAWT